MNPYSLVIGLLGLSWIVLQGTTWLGIKTIGDLYERVKRARGVMLIVFAVLFAAATAATALLVPEAFAQATSSVAGWLFIVLAIAGAILVRVGSNGKDRMAFYGSSLAGASMVGIWAVSIFPQLVPSLGPGEALTVANSASSQLTLTVMLIIAAIGVPLVLFYFFLIYRTYAGRIDMTQSTDGHY